MNTEQTDIALWDATVILEKWIKFLEGGGADSSVIQEFRTDIMEVIQLWGEAYLSELAALIKKERNN